MHPIEAAEGERGALAPSFDRVDRGPVRLAGRKLGPEEGVERSGRDTTALFDDGTA